MSRFLRGLMPAAILCIIAMPVAAQTNLLMDPSFTLGADIDDDGIPDPDPLTCSIDDADVPFSSYWQAENGTARRNPSTHMPVDTTPENGIETNCGRTLNADGTVPDPADDYTRGGLSIGSFETTKFWQIVDGLTPGTSYTLKGVWTGGNDTGAPWSYQAEIRETDETGAVLASAEGNLAGGATFDWETFSITAQAPASGSIAVVFAGDLSFQWGAKSLHVDDLWLIEESTCTAPPTISSVTPGYAAQGETAAAVTIAGSNYIDGDTTVTLTKAGETDIVASTVTVDAGGNSLTATFDLTGAALGYWNVQVATTGCPPASLGSSFYVLLSGPGLSNGSFENPLPDPSLDTCPLTQELGPPDDWYIFQFDNWGGPFDYRDELDTFPPSCPVPDGFHYLSANTTHGSGNVYATQSVLATAGATYTLSGYLAGGGDNTAVLTLVDGDRLSTTTTSKTIYDGTDGPYDWTFGFVTAQISSNIVTPTIEVNNPDTPSAWGRTKALHVDNVVLEICSAPITVDSIDTTSFDYQSAASGVTIIGSGFSSGSTPTVMLVRPGTVVTATNVTVSDDNTLTADFDFATAPTGTYDLIIMKDGCGAQLNDAATILADQLLNGEFEEPTVAGTCVQLNQKVTGWHNLDQLVRDNQTNIPACPRNLPAPDPADEHGHYGSMTGNTDGLQRAWQTIRVSQGTRYRFGGYFAGGGVSTTKIRLIDGDNPAALSALAETIVAEPGLNENPLIFGWQYAEVVATAESDLMTVVWELAPGAPAEENSFSSHADGLVFETACSAPFADADADGDVDQQDFAVLQVCFTGANAAISSVNEYCSCFDVEGAGGLPDGDIDSSDVVRFELCASGPDVPADPACVNLTP